MVIPEPPVPDIIAPMPTPDEPCGPELKAKLRVMPSFNKAYAAAKQGGCGNFEWCQIITVPETTPQTAQGWEARSGQNTGGGAAVGDSWRKKWRPHVLTTTAWYIFQIAWYFISFIL